MKLASQEACFGCHACEYKCPVNAINFYDTGTGFLYPRIDENKCIKCRKCEQICQEVQESSFVKRPIKSYGVKHKNDGIRIKSSSGAAYPAIVEAFAENQEVSIVGAVFDTEAGMKVRHLDVYEGKLIEASQKSKYVQSDISRVYDMIYARLSEGKKVLFVGTPCQVAGVKSCFKDCDSLFSVDLICHGVGSPGIWGKYIGFLEKKYADKIIGYDFRDKDKGWEDYHTKIVFESGREIAEGFEESMYLRLFNQDMIMRSSCYQCPFSAPERISDITIGDFWGVEKVRPEFKDSLGVSLVLLNSDAGIALFEKMKKFLFYFETCLEDASQHNLKMPTVCPKETSYFWRDYQIYGFEKVLKKYAKYNMTGRFRYEIKRMVKR